MTRPAMLLALLSLTAQASGEVLRAETNDGNLVIYKGELASGQMRDHIASFVQRRQAGSPNPVSHADLHAAIGPWSN